MISVTIQGKALKILIFKENLPLFEMMQNTDTIGI